MKMLVGFGLLTILIFSTAVMGQGYPALSETSYNYFGAGARAFAMGDAYVGLSNDITSGTWNPAGIWVIESPVVSVSYNIYKPKGEFTDSWATSYPLRSSGNSHRKRPGTTTCEAKPPSMWLPGICCFWQTLLLPFLQSSHSPHGNTAGMITFLPTRFSNPAPAATTWPLIS